MEKFFLVILGLVVGLVLGGVIGYNGGSSSAIEEANIVIQGQNQRIAETEQSLTEVNQILEEARQNFQVSEQSLKADLDQAQTVITQYEEEKKEREASENLATVGKIAGALLMGL